MLELVDLTKSYGGRAVLANLSHRFAPGEFVAVMGESGVGKSTLLNLIAGLDTPDGGQVVVDGVPMSGLDDDAATKLRRSRMGFIFQAFHVLPHLTLEQNVALPLLLNGAPDPAARAPCWTPSACGTRRRLPAPAVRRRAAAGGDRARPGAPPRPAAGRRADRQPGPGNGRRHPAPAARRDPESGAGAIMVTHSHAAAAMADRILVLTRSGLKLT
jgi:putative ABC transport system ATP-binding protein